VADRTIHTVGCKSFPDFAGTAGEIPVNSYNRPYQSVLLSDSSRIRQQRVDRIERGSQRAIAGTASSRTALDGIQSLISKFRPKRTQKIQPYYSNLEI